MDRSKLLNIDYGPFFDKGLFEGVRNYLTNSDLTSDESIKDGYREITPLVKGAGALIVNLRTRRIHLRLVDEETIKDLASHLPIGIPREVKLVQEARLVNG